MAYRSPQEVLAGSTPASDTPPISFRDHPVSRRTALPAPGSASRVKMASRPVLFRLPSNARAHKRRPWRQEGARVCHRMSAGGWGTPPGVSFSTPPGPCGSCPANYASCPAQVRPRAAAMRSQTVSIWIAPSACGDTWEGEGRGGLAFCVAPFNPVENIRSGGATSGSRTASLNPTTISSTTAARNGTSSSLSPRGSCPSDYGAEGFCWYFRTAFLRVC
jgi:hypothetical protein